MRFDINRRPAKNGRITISSKLLSVARAVHERRAGPVPADVVDGLSDRMEPRLHGAVQHVVDGHLHLTAVVGVLLAEVVEEVQAVAVEEGYGRPIMSTFHGVFSIGGGYSSVDSFVGTIDLRQNNFLGRGWQASLAIRAGGTSQQGILSFTEPWLFDRAMTLYQLAFRSGSVTFLRHAHRNAQFYANHIDAGGHFDMRGYGQTERPAEIEKYTLLHLVGDMVGLLDALEAPSAAIAGHDWGAPVAWHAALLRPDRFRAVVAGAVGLAGALAGAGAVIRAELTPPPPPAAAAQDAAVAAALPERNRRRASSGPTPTDSERSHRMSRCNTTIAAA